jgi:hypothetical protein
MTTMTPRFALNASASAETAVERARRASRNATLSPSGPAPTVTRVLVTPAMAMDWLDNANTSNRKVSDAHVQRLARDMASGEWKLTHEGIAFDPSGILLDGQHRLWAVVMSETPVEMHVWRNVTREALMAIDCGKSRSLCDVLRLGGGHGEVGTTDLAVLRAMLGGLAGPVALSPSQAAEALGKHAAAVKLAVEALPRARWIACAATRAVIGRAYYSCDHDRLREFGRMLGTGVVPEGGAVAVVLLRQFLSEKAGHSRQAGHERYTKTQRALVAFLKGEAISRLYAATQEHFPLPEEVAR